MGGFLEKMGDTN
jgi:hypothetical protein